MLYGKFEQILRFNDNNKKKRKKKGKKVLPTSWWRWHKDRSTTKCKRNKAILELNMETERPCQKCWMDE